MTRQATIAICTMVIVVVTGMLLTTSVTAVRLVQEDGTILVCERTAPDDRVILTFTHSMYGGDVTEIWTTTEHGLDRQQMLTDNAAAAEYYAWDGRVERSGDRFLVVTQPLHEDVLVVRVDQIGRHRLTIGDEAFDLAAMVGSTAQVSIEPVSASLWQGSPC